MRKIIYILLLVVTGSLYSQPITWQRTYWSPHGPDTDELRSICCLSNGDYIAVGTTRTGIEAYIYAMRINGYGDTTWTKLLPGGETYSMEKTNDGNLIIASYYCALIKINENGNVIWEKGQYNNSAYIKSVKQTINNGYILCGRIDSSSRSYPYVLLTDSLGNLLWQKKFTDSVSSGSFSDLTVTNNGDFILTGNYNKPDSLNEYLFVVKMKLDGNVISFKRFDFLSAYYVNTIEKTNDYGFLIGGLSLRYVRCTFLIKLDSSANIQWLKYYDNSQSYYQKEITDIIKTYNNFYIIIGWSDTTKFGDVYCRIIKIDSLGNEIWRKYYGFLNENSHAFCGKETNDSGLIMVGSLNQNRYNLYIIKTDSNGYAYPPIGIKPASNEIPQSFLLHQNYPNPFNPSTVISFDVGQDSPRLNRDGNDNIMIKVFDVAGREVEILVDKNLKPGKYSIEWSPKNLPSGIYFCSMYVDDRIVQSIKLVLVK